MLALEEDRVEGLRVEVGVERLAVGADPAVHRPGVDEVGLARTSGGRGRCGGPWSPPRRRTPAPGRRRGSSGAAARRCRWPPGPRRRPAASRPRRSRSGRRRRSAPGSWGQAIEARQSRGRGSQAMTSGSSRPTAPLVLARAEVGGEVDPGVGGRGDEALVGRRAARPRCRSRRRAAARDGAGGEQREQVVGVADGVVERPVEERGAVLAVRSGSGGRALRTARRPRRTGRGG